MQCLFCHTDTHVTKTNVKGLIDLISIFSLNDSSTARYPKSPILTLRGRLRPARALLAKEVHKIIMVVTRYLISFKQVLILILVSMDLIILI